MKKATSSLLKRASLSSTITIVSLAILAAVLLVHLRSLVPGWSSAELATRTSSHSLHYILLHPVNSPYRLIVYGLLKLFPHSVLAVRLASVIYGAVVAILFYFIVRCWHSPNIAWLATLLFATSTWYLRTSRLGTPDVLLFGLLILTALGLWLQRTRHRKTILALTFIAGALSVYVPGLIWFVLFAGVWQRHILRDVIRRAPAWLLPFIGLGIIIVLAPIVWAMTRHGSVALNMLGLPNHLPNPVHVLKRLAEVPLNIFVRGPFQPGLWIGRSPVLDVFETALFIIGVYAYWQHRRLARVASLLSIFIVTSLLVALGGPITLTLLLPFVYLVIATGLAFLLGEWLSTFPRNPLARGVGAVVVILAVGFSCVYHLDRYFIAWPHDPATHSTFSQHPPS